VTLYVTPVFYTYFDELPGRVRGWTRSGIGRLRGRRGPELVPGDAMGASAAPTPWRDSA
jgi:hypothetical protein